MRMVCRVNVCPNNSSWTSGMGASGEWGWFNWGGGMSWSELGFASECWSSSWDWHMFNSRLFMRIV